MTAQEQYSEVASSTTIVPNVISGTSPLQAKAKEAYAYLCGVVDTHFFLVCVLVAICIAAMNPALGKDGGPLATEITTSYVATMLIFILSGLTLKTGELIDAFMDVKFNVFVQCFNFLLIPVLFFIFGLMCRGGALDGSLFDGLIILGCLPTSVNMCVVLTASAGGNEPAALFNATFGNLLGIFLTPGLIYMFLAESSTVPFEEALAKLMIKVVVPLAVGQILQYFPHAAIKPFIKKHKKILKRAQDVSLATIVYATFCNMFSSGIVISGGTIIATLAILLMFQLIFMSSSWGLMTLMKLTTPVKTAGLFASVQKTIALGIPLINTLYEGSPHIGMYTIPLLIYHPMQLILGSFLVSRLKALNEQNKIVAQQLAEETIQSREVINPMNSIDVGVVVDTEIGTSSLEEEDEEELTPPLKVNLVELSNIAPKKASGQVLQSIPSSDDDVYSPFQQQSLW